MTPNILDSIDKDARTILYPSSCQYSDEFQDIPFDAVILNSRDFPQNEKKGKVLCLNYDNNELLGLLRVRYIKISALVIIREGCVEGGNYECIAKEGFFGRLTPIVAEPFDYICDHEPPTPDVPAHFEEFEPPDYLVPFEKHSSTPLNRIRSFHVTSLPVIEKDLLLGRIRVKVIWDSVWRSYSQSDLVVAKSIGGSRQAVKYYLKGLSLNRGYELLRESRKLTIADYLHRAQNERLSRLLLMPIARGSYETIVDEIQNWSGDFPKEILFYHLNRNDYRYLKG